MKRLFLFLTAILLCAATMHARKPLAKHVVMIAIDGWGGIKKTHGGSSLSELETPFIIAGKHVKRGGEFEESMMQYDTAATIAYIFGLNQPQVWTGRPMTQVFK